MASKNQEQQHPQERIDRPIVDLDLILEKWQLDEASLWAKTRQLHSHGQVYQMRQTEEQQDWS